MDIAALRAKPARKSVIGAAVVASSLHNMELILTWSKSPRSKRPQVFDNHSPPCPKTNYFFFFSFVVFHYSCLQYLRDSSSAPRRHLARCVRDYGRNGLGSAFSLIWKVLAYSFLLLYFIHFFVRALIMYKLLVFIFGMYVV